VETTCAASGAAPKPHRLVPYPALSWVARLPD
jgi:hypothetical protein